MPDRVWADEPPVVQRSRRNDMMVNPAVTKVKQMLSGCAATATRVDIHRGNVCTTPSVSITTKGSFPEIRRIQ